MSEGIIERLRYEAAVRPNALSSLYPGDVLEVVDAAIARAEHAEAALLDNQQPCVWTHDGVYWSGQCGVQESRPGRYCQECGHPTKPEVQP